jgi:GT2 family glycosyltransferase
LSKQLAIVSPVADLKIYSKDLLINLLNSIVEGKTYEIAEVIICFDGCQENFIDFFREKFPFIQAIVNPGKRLNFSKNSNLGLRYAHKELRLPVLLVNQDCILPAKEHIEKLINPPEVGIVTPETTTQVDDLLNNKEVIFTETQGLFAFYCPFIPLEVMDEIGYIDPGSIAFSDDNYLVRAYLAGFKGYICNIKIHHAGSHVDQNQIGSSLCGSYTGDRLNIDHQRFCTQWQIDPNKVVHKEYIAHILKNFKWNKELMYVH